MYRRVSFITRSLLWSLLFYLISLVILDWKNVVASLKSNDGRKAYVTSERCEQSLPRVATIKASPEIGTVEALNSILRLAGYLGR